MDKLSKLTSCVSLPLCCSEGLLENRCGLELSEVGEVGDVLVGAQKNVIITIKYVAYKHFGRLAKIFISAHFNTVCLWLSVCECCFSCHVTGTRGHMTTVCCR